MSRYADVQEEIKCGFPSIEVNQHWVALDDKGEVMREVRILAPHPDGGWIHEDKPSKLIPTPSGMGRCPEFNLRYVFRPKE